MGTAKKIIFFISLMALLLGAASLPLYGDFKEWYMVLRYGYTDRDYLTIAAGEDGILLLSYRESADRLCLRFSDLDGKNATEWVPELPAEAVNGNMVRGYPADRETAFLEFYEENSRYMTVYRVTKGGEAERILRLDCGEDLYPSDRREACQMGTFEQRVDDIQFAVLRRTVLRDDAGLTRSMSTTATVYACSREGGGARQLSETELAWDPDWPTKKCVAVLPDGGVAIGGPEFLQIDGVEVPGMSGQLVTRLVCRDSRLYYIDANTEMMWRATEDGSGVEEFMDLRGQIDPSPLYDIAVTPAGHALILQDGWSLRHVYPGGTESLSGALYPSRVVCALLVLGVLAGAALVAALLRFVFFSLRRGSVPLALHWSVVLLAVAMVLGLWLHHFVIVPAAREDLNDVRKALLNRVYSEAADINRMEESARDSLLSYWEGTFEDLIEQLAVPGMRQSSVTIAEWSEEQGAYLAADGGYAELRNGFSSMEADHARSSGTVVTGHSEGIYIYAFPAGDRVVMITLDADSTPNVSAIEPKVLIVICAVALAAMLILFAVGRSIQNLGRGVERYARQEPWKRLDFKTADELEGIANSLNSMAADREKEERQRNRMVESYRRFVPEKVLELLGRKSVLDVDKNTFSSREMAVMMVSFSFPESVYSPAGNSRLLFDSVNAVIERTAPVATRQGGTVFNFAYNGYDVMMEKDPALLVSTAVALQQEVLAFNERRAQDGLPTVTFRIALDVGNVMLGVVGDDGQLEPTAISSSFSTVRALIGLCGRLDAGILCTEAISPGLAGYGSRYMGKCRVDGAPVRVYEVFDGDPYEARKAKEASLGQFYQGVQEFYSGDAASAKRTFLELVHGAPKDGGARYYLYLADRFSGKDFSPEDLSL